MKSVQTEFEVRCEWGEQGVRRLAPISDAVVIVDTLSFSTCAEIATARDAIVFPFRWKDEAAQSFAASVNAELAGRRGTGGYTLSPASLTQLPAGVRLVLPSPNGATLSLLTGATPTLAGCLRNSRALALAAMKFGRCVAVIPAGERWADGGLRPAFEDLIAAGAIIRHLIGSLSPEAEMAQAAFANAQADLRRLLADCVSGKELITRGYEVDVELAAQLDVSDCVPRLVDEAYVKQTH